MELKYNVINSLKKEFHTTYVYNIILQCLMRINPSKRMYTW